MANIPKRLRRVFQCVTPRKGITPEIYGDIFTSRVTLEQLQRYIARKKKNTAPGVSGIRIDHIAALPTEYKEMVAQLLSIPYISGEGYEDWNQEIVNWVQKIEGNDELTKQRPLMYYEVLVSV